MRFDFNLKEKVLYLSISIVIGIVLAIIVSKLNFLINLIAFVVGLVLFFVGLLSSEHANVTLLPFSITFCACLFYEWFKIFA